VKQRYYHITSWIFIWLAIIQLVVIFGSWLITSLVPNVHMLSLLSSEGIRWYLGGVVDDLASPVLVWIILCCITYGAVVRSRILHFDRHEYRQRIGIQLVLLELFISIIIMTLLIAVPHAILLSVSGDLFPSGFSRSIVPVVTFTVSVMSVSFGAVSGNLKRVEDVVEAMTIGLGWGSPLIIIYIVLCQLLYSLGFVFSVNFP
jgi:aminobenzoyl-glutamate transport protein